MLMLTTIGLGARYKTHGQQHTGRTVLTSALASKTGIKLAIVKVN